MSVVTTNGCFDILHVGHIDFLNRCKGFGDFLVVGINSDASVMRLKGKGRPIFPDWQRAMVLSSLRAVDVVHIFGEDGPCEFIKVVCPQIHVKGIEYAELDIPEKKLCEELGIDLRFLPHKYSISTSGIVRRIVDAQT